MWLAFEMIVGGRFYMEEGAWHQARQHALWRYTPGWNLKPLYKIRVLLK